MAVAGFIPYLCCLFFLKSKPFISTMHYQDTPTHKEEDTQQLYSLEPQPHPVSEEKRAQLTALAKNYCKLDNKFKAEPFFSRQEYYVISAKWLQRWKVYVGYKEVNGAVPPNKYFGCGTLPTCNEDIVESRKFGSFDFDEPDYHLNIRLKAGLQEGSDYEFITKEMHYALQDCEDYEMIRIPREVVKTKEGKKVEIYYFKLNLLLIYNTLCKSIERDEVTKFPEITFQYSHYAKVSALAHHILPYIKREALKNKYIYLSEGLPLRFWLMPTDFQKNILLNTYRQGCKANPSYAYKLYIDADFLESDDTLAEYDILDNGYLMAEIREEKMNWLLFSTKKILEGSCNFCKEVKYLKVFCSCKYSVYCSTTCKTKDKFSHKNRCPNEAESDQEETEMKLTEHSNKGRTGLRNLGNTCFMNSGLQCISHVKALTEYFVTNKYIKDINKENPLGTRGELSTAFAKMVQNLWFGQEASFSPTQLKKAIGKYQPMFSGYSQHDSSELIGYLLDGLHQDLNRVKQKPYVETKDYDGRPDLIIAKEAWENFLKRNQSVIVDLMYGQYKSVLDCPKCSYQSVQFDPFLLVSLPIVNAKKKTMEVVFLRNHLEETRITLSYESSAKLRIEWAMSQVKAKLGLAEATKLIAYLASSSACQTLKDGISLQQIRREHSYRTLYMRQLIKDENPETDLKVVVTNVLCHSIYGNENYRKSMVNGRLYFFSKALTYKQVHYRIYSYYKQFYEIANYEQEIIKADPKDQPFRILCMPATYYNPCDYCAKKSCEGCFLKFNDDKFMPEQPLDKKVEIELYWRKNAKEIQEKMESMASEAAKSGGKDTKGGVKIEDCFELFQQAETLAEDNAWFCPKCKDFVQAKKQMQIYKAPKLLILCLKRFKRKEYHNEKYTILVDYPVEGLDLSKYVINPQLPEVSATDEPKNQYSKPIYDLIGVSNHMGSTGGGHYTAYCKDITTQEWFEFDDSYVSRVKDPRQVVSEAGYVLFYMRRD